MIRYSRTVCLRSRLILAKRPAARTRRVIGCDAAYASYRSVNTSRYREMPSRDSLISRLIAATAYRYCRTPSLVSPFLLYTLFFSIRHFAVFSPNIA